MATALDISPSPEKAYYLRLQALLVDGGTLVLRSLLESRYTTAQWNTFLNQPQTRVQITQLRHRKIITQVQFDLLYPLTGATDISQYDISLLVCVLRNLCGLNSRSPVWNGIPSSVDISEEADIRRLSIERNELVGHSTSASMSKSHFDSKWLDIEKVMTRLGGNIPDLQQNIDNLRKQSIDPEKETELMGIIKAWEVSDQALQEDLKEMEAKIKGHENMLDSLGTQTELLTKTTDDIFRRSVENEERIHNTDKDTKMLRKQVNFHEEQIQNLVADTCKLKLEMSPKIVNYKDEQQIGYVERPSQDSKCADSQRSYKTQSSVERRINVPQELKNLLSVTRMFLDDCIPDEIYVRTQMYIEAKEKLERNNVVVLSGHPGEGKTSMATKLMLEVTTVEKCLKLAKPSDWRYVDFEMFDTIFIDDMFGPGVMDRMLVKDWEYYLSEIWNAIQKKALKVIIATRHYIIEEAKPTLNKSQIFQDKHAQFLSSNDLSIDDRTQILTAHMRYNDMITTDNQKLIHACVRTSSAFLHTFFTRKQNFLFGFPECVRMFVQNEELFKRGADFFSKPNDFFRKCLEQLKQDEERFLALLVVWSTEDKILYQRDLDLSSTSEKVSDILKLFGFKLKGKLIKTLRNSLKHHKDGFLRFSRFSSCYSFSHNVISDMVGLVISEDYPEACLQLTDKQFLFEYITIEDGKRTKFNFFVEQYLHSKLMDTFLRLSIVPEYEFDIFLRRLYYFSLRYNTVFSHDAFTDRRFVNQFVSYLLQTNLTDRIFANHVMVIWPHSVSSTMKLGDMYVFPPTFSVYHGDGLLFMELLRQNVLFSMNEKDLKEEIYNAFLLAAKKNNVDVLKALISLKVDIPSEAIHIAAENQHIKILQLLLRNQKKIVKSRCKFNNNNNALMVSVKMGFVDSVKHLVSQTDLSQRNDSNVSALDKAVRFRQKEICEILIKNGAPINEKGGKFKRTPLHTASDMGLSQVVVMLLNAGARTDIKDHKGHYPIHCAAMQKQTEVVKILAKHDTTQVRQRIAAYGKNSKIKGMTVFHVAILKGDLEMVNTLLEVSQDCNTQDFFGRTPIYYASYEGREDIVRALVPHADVTVPEKQGYTPLHAAIYKVRTNIIPLLLPHSNVNARDRFGQTPLHRACDKGIPGIIEHLLVANADFNMVTGRGETVYEILTEKRKDADALVEVDVDCSLACNPNRNADACIKLIQAYSNGAKNSPRCKNVLKI